MEREMITELSLERLRTIYRTYLQNKKYSPSTISTSCTEAFYLWRKTSKERFWHVVNSSDFETIAKKELTLALEANSKGDAQTHLSNYIAHLRRFRVFIESGGNFESSESNVEQNIHRKTSITKKSKVNVPRPSIEQVEMYLKRWSDLENYSLQESALDRLFFELCPLNDKISDILIKAATLNDFYSTNIFSIYPVAKHICSLNIDSRLALGDVTLVKDIQSIEINGKLKNFYSFATKYCSHHNPLAYPIYDSYVDEVLRYLRSRDEFSTFKDIELKEYKAFKQILEDFRIFYGLEKYNLKQIDQYLWQLGKEYFPKNYEKQIKGEKSL